MHHCIISIYLQCDLVVGPVTIGVPPSLPVKGVALILGIDLASQRVTSTDSEKPSSWVPACVVTQSMAKRKEAETTKDDEEINTRQEVVESTSYFPVVEELVSTRGSERDQFDFTLSWQELIR